MSLRLLPAGAPGLLVIVALLALAALLVFALLLGERDDGLVLQAGELDAARREQLLGRCQFAAATTCRLLLQRRVAVGIGLVLRLNRDDAQGLRLSSQIAQMCAADAEQPLVGVDNRLVLLFLHGRALLALQVGDARREDAEVSELESANLVVEQIADHLPPRQADALDVTALNELRRTDRITALDFRQDLDVNPRTLDARRDRRKASHSLLLVLALLRLELLDDLEIPNERIPANVARRPTDDHVAVIPVTDETAVDDDGVLQDDRLSSVHGDEEELLAVAVNQIFQLRTRRQHAPRLRVNESQRALHRELLASPDQHLGVLVELLLLGLAVSVQPLDTCRFGLRLRFLLSLGLRCRLGFLARDDIGLDRAEHSHDAVGIGLLRLSQRHHELRTRDLLHGDELLLDLVVFQVRHVVRREIELVHFHAQRHLDTAQGVVGGLQDGRGQHRFHQRIVLRELSELFLDHLLGHDRQIRDAQGIQHKLNGLRKLRHDDSPVRPTRGSPMQKTL